MFKSFLSLFLEPNCPLCERPGDTLLCRDCNRQLQGCQLADKSQFWQGDLPLFVWGSYGGILKQAIAALKYDGHRELGELMGQWLGQAWLASPRLGKTKKLTVVPIPLAPQRLADRGFNQADLMARSFAQMTGYPLQIKGLQRVRETKAMFGLNPTEREKNLREAFRLGKGFQPSRPPSPVLLLDDIYTTGTTVTEAARILRQHKIPIFGVAAFSKAAPSVTAKPSFDS